MEESIEGSRGSAIEAPSVETISTYPEKSPRSKNVGPPRVLTLEEATEAFTTLGGEDDLEDAPSVQVYQGASKTQIPSVDPELWTFTFERQDLGEEPDPYLAEKMIEEARSMVDEAIIMDSSSHDAMERDSARSRSFSWVSTCYDRVREFILRPSSSSRPSDRSEKRLGWRCVSYFMLETTLPKLSQIDLWEFTLGYLYQHG